MVGQKTNVPHIGGVEGHVAHLADELTERGHDVTVFTRSGYGTAAAGAVNVRRRPCLHLKHFEAISHATLCSFETLASRFDVVHYHGVGPALTVPVASLRPKARVCVTVHDQDYNKRKWSSFARYWLRAGERVACERADEIIVVARYLEEHLLQTYGREARYVPNGYSPVDLLPPGDLLAEHGLEPGKYLLFLARLVPEKGCDVLIEAVRRSQTPYRVAIVGGASHSAEYTQSLCALAEGDSRFVFLGHQSGDALAEIRASAACFVMPSYQEGLPLALLEALWSGLEVIASDIPAVHEVDGSRASSRITLVPPGDSDALRHAIDALHFPNRTYHHEGIEWPSWSEVAERVEDVYLGRPSPSPREREPVPVSVQPPGVVTTAVRASTPEA